MNQSVDTINLISSIIFDLNKCLRIFLFLRSLFDSISILLSKNIEFSFDARCPFDKSVTDGLQDWCSLQSIGHERSPTQVSVLIMHTQLTVVAPIITSVIIIYRVR